LFMLAWIAWGFHFFRKKTPMIKKYADAIRVASTLNMSREDWLKHRGAGIGSSDAAVAIGLSPYKSPLTLWLEKTKRKTPDDLSDKEAVIWGTVLESPLAEEYAKRTGRKVRRVNSLLQHSAYPFMLANLDREAICPINGTGILEIKTAGYHSAPQWEDGVPIAYECQVLHQLAITGHAWADVAVLIGGQDFRIYRIERDEGKIADLIAREQQFWGYVERDVQPMPDGTQDASKALQWLYPRSNGKSVDWREKPDFNLLFQELLNTRQQKDQIESKESLLKQQIQNELGEAEIGIFAGGRVTWKQAKSRIAPDVDKLALEHPDLVAQYAIPIEGSRRFLVQPLKV
jgi:putative phage-type endonuclease